MAEAQISKEVTNRIGRAFALLYSRTAMYNIDHPFAEQSLEGFYKEISYDLNICSPLVLIMHQDQFFVEEEQLDPRINTSKMLQHFKKGLIHSVSFEKGLSEDELKTFVNIFIDLTNYSNADAMVKACEEQGVTNIKINHVFYKKVTADDEVVNRKALKKATSAAGQKTESQKTAKIFEMMAENALAEELNKSLSLTNIIQNPGGISKKMIETDRAVTDAAPDQTGGGAVIMHNLKKIQQEVDQASPDMSGKNLQQLALAVFDMKKDLLKGIEAQQASGMSFEYGEAILEEANEITDKVLIQLIKDEYQQGRITVLRLALIMRRLLPDPKELQRLMPQIKDALLEEGMPLDTFLKLSEELKNEFQGEALAKALEKSAEEIGISGETLINEINMNPKGAAELIYLASEIRKGTGDDKVMTDLLVDYVERVGSKIALDAADQTGEEGGKQLRGIITSIESALLGQLKNKDIDTAVVRQVAQRLNDRLEACIDNLESRFEAVQQGAASGGDGEGLNSVLEIFEKDADEEEDLKDLLEKIRTSVDDEGLDENDFEQVHQAASQVMTPSQKRASQVEESTPISSVKAAKVILPKGVLKRNSFVYILEKEMARSRRYDTPFALVLIGIHKIKPDIHVDPETIPSSGVIGLILEKLTPHIRESDIFGMLDDEKIVVILPMAKKENSRKAMGRLLKIIHEEKYIYNEIPLTVRLAGAVVPYDSDMITSVNGYLDRIESDLNDMLTRLKSVQSLY
jgi:GGDEF domain-containing protein